MTHRIRVQGGAILYQAVDENTDLDMSIHGKVIIGNDTYTDVITTTNGANMLIRTTRGGHMVVSTASAESNGNGILEINNIQWPDNLSGDSDGATVFVYYDRDDGQFKLKFKSMSLGTLSGTSVTAGMLSALYPLARPGQFVEMDNALAIRSAGTMWFLVKKTDISNTAAYEQTYMRLAWSDALIAGKPAFGFVSETDYTIPAGFTGSIARLGAPNTVGPLEIEIIHRVGVSSDIRVGTISFAAGDTIGVFSVAGDIDIHVGDLMKFGVSTSSVVDTAHGLYVTLATHRYP